MMFHNCTPMPVVANVEAATDWFIQHLGFAMGSSIPETYAFLYRDKAAIRLLKAGEYVDLKHPSAQQIIYIDVADVDETYEDHKASIETLPEAERRAPFDRYYGQREFHLIYEHLLVMVGSTLPKDPV